MLEARITDDDDLYERLKKFSTYHSDLTKVLELPDNCYNMVPDRYVTLFEQEGKFKYEITYKSNAFYFKNIDDSLRLYLGIYLPYSKSVPVKQTQHIYNLIESGVAGRDSFFKKVFSPISSSDKISILNTYNSITRVRVNGRYNKFDKSLADVRCGDLFKNVTVKSTPVKTIECKVVTCDSRLTNKNKKPYLDIALEYFNDNGVKSRLNFSQFGNINMLQRILSPGATVSILVKEDGSFHSFVPNGMEITSIDTVSQGKESKKLYKMPVAMFRILYYEYLIRNEHARHN